MIKVLVIDDSALVRKLLTDILNEAAGIEVVGTASDPLIARERIKKLQPDVLTLDIEMPRMDGLTFLANLMRLRPMPVVMVSTLTEKGADVTLRALELGAIDFVSKPKADFANAIHDYARELVEKVRTAAVARVRALPSRVDKPLKVDKKLSADAVLAAKTIQHYHTTDKLIAIGASTGGTEAIKEVLADLPADFPGIVISQHIPAAFSASFAQRLDATSALVVSEAKDGEQILPGHAYIAPGDRHLLLKRSGARFMIQLHDGPAVNRHKPSVDVMFRSVAQHAGPNAVGVILTGMGDDGAKGLKEMRDAGAHTCAQDENSSVVWGMPGEAVKCGGAASILPLQDVASHLIKKLR
ncbi:MAG: chemotaxis response regulator protein-glutamate methylesterase [Mariprofundaceae bacterium]|nr:chemotaxis response regulator protein-glutamate methylesterase [Mariprofundaceae bacterium]